MSDTWDVDTADHSLEDVPAPAAFDETTDAVEEQPDGTLEVVEVKIQTTADEPVRISVPAPPGVLTLEPGKPVSVSPEFAEQASVLPSVELV